MRDFDRGAFRLGEESTRLLSGDVAQQCVSHLGVGNQCGAEKARITADDKAKKHYAPITLRELMLFLAGLLFMTHYGLPRTEFWAKSTDLFPTIDLKKLIGIGRNRFSAILCCLRFAPPLLGPESSEYYQIDALVAQYSRALFSQRPDQSAQAKG